MCSPTSFPPTGAKGLNLAVNEVRLLAAALSERYEHGSAGSLDRYSGLPATDDF